MFGLRVSFARAALLGAAALVLSAGTALGHGGGHGGGGHGGGGHMGAVGHAGGGFAHHGVGGFGGVGRVGFGGVGRIGGFGVAPLGFGRFGVGGLSYYGLGYYPYLAGGLGGYGGNYPYRYYVGGYPRLYGSGYYSNYLAPYGYTGSYGYNAPYGYTGSTYNYSSYYSNPSSTVQPPPAEDNKSHLLVHVPANAELWFNDYKSTQTGAEREFVTPPLSPGQSYSYQVKVRWTADGKPHEETRTVHVVANSWQQVDLTKPAAPPKKDEPDVPPVP